MDEIKSAGLCYTDESIITKGFAWIIRERPSDFEIGLELLRMSLDYPHLHCNGGYPIDIDLSLPHVVITAEPDPGKENNHYLVMIYSRRKLKRVGKAARRHISLLFQRSDGRVDMVDWHEDMLEWTMQEVGKCHRRNPGADDDDA